MLPALAGLSRRAVPMLPALAGLSRRAARRCTSLRSSDYPQQFCSSASRSPAPKIDEKENAAEEKEKAARELVFGQGGEYPTFPYAQVAFTAFVLGSYVAYVKLIEEPAEAAELLAHPQPVVVPLPQGAMKRLPDGRLVMEDGSIRRPPS